MCLGSFFLLRFLYFKLVVAREQARRLTFAIEQTRTRQGRRRLAEIETETGQTESEVELLDRLALDKHRHEPESLIATHRNRLSSLTPQS